MSAGTGARRRTRRANAEAQSVTRPLKERGPLALYVWRAYHKRQNAIYRALLEEPGACYYAANLRGMA